MSAATILKQQLRVARRLWPEERAPELEHFEHAIERAEREWNDQQPRAANFSRRRKPAKQQEEGK